MTLFQLQITRIPYPGKDWKDSTSLVLPMIFDSANNRTQLAEKRESTATCPTVTLHINKFMEFFQAQNANNELSLYPCVLDLLKNFVLPNEQQPPQMGPQQQVGPVMVGQVSFKSVCVFIFIYFIYKIYNF